MPGLRSDKEVLTGRVGVLFGDPKMCVCVCVTNGSMNQGPEPNFDTHRLDQNHAWFGASCGALEGWQTPQLIITFQANCPV